MASLAVVRAAARGMRNAFRIRVIFGQFDRMPNDLGETQIVCSMSDAASSSILAAIERLGRFTTSLTPGRVRRRLERARHIDHDDLVVLGADTAV